MEKQKFSARVKQAMGEASITNLYQLNGMVPVHKAIPFGLQHILAMFVANIAPILIVGGACGLAASDMAMLIQSAMLIAGIGTLVQLFPIFHIMLCHRHPVFSGNCSQKFRKHQIQIFLRLYFHTGERIFFMVLPSDTVYHLLAGKFL